VAAFLDSLGLPQKGVAVERNREIVPKSRYVETVLQAGDRIEIVQFVGGG
jgi:sulfur carrier protein